MTLEAQLRWAAETPFEGWDFSALRDRARFGEPTWSFTEVLRELIQPGVRSMLDVGTGGGEFLARFAPLPALTVATEAWLTNVPIAAATLAKAAHVVQYSVPADNGKQWGGESEPFLPFRDSVFDLVMARHESYLPLEIARVLRAGGVFATQQLSGNLTAAVRGLFDRPPPKERSWDLDVAVAQVEAAGLRVERSAKAAAVYRFFDVGALVYWLRAVPWELPDLHLEHDRPRLHKLHEQTTGGTPIDLPATYLLVVACKP